MKIQAEIWLHEAISGQELSTEQRRHVVAWLMGTGEYTAAEMAVMFKVNERTIITDKSKIREMMAESMRSEDPLLIISDLRMAYENSLRIIQKGLKKAKVGTKTYLDYAKAIPELQDKYVQRCQELGILPKNLGTLEVQRFEFKASVGLEGSNQRPVKMFTSEPPTIPGEVVEAKAITDGKDSSSKTSGDVPEAANITNSNTQGGDATAPASTQLSTVQTDSCVGSPIPPPRSKT